MEDVTAPADHLPRSFILTGHAAVITWHQSLAVSYTQAACDVLNAMLTLGRMPCSICPQVNAALANDIGNLLNRTLGLLAKNCGGALPTAASSVPVDNPVRRLAEQQACFVHSCPEQNRGLQ